ncbi:MAG: hypothetical protein JJLCMIEE_00215 [Acidimicrobiales bacterium]|nr:MAG: hypothetical protein EDR02_01345 [Actinomycetota bacterium]MBV6507174.1 hypothetical protein [Acidimicrobiales bacterium]RIK05533.1 MAG: hypothetical protein DCC48_09585 [Acidobacteriota bacterium]
MQTPSFEIPRIRALARHALPSIAEGVIVPVALFILTLWLLGVWGAIAVGTVWSYGSIVRRLIAKKRVPGLLLLATVTITARTIIAAATGSVFVYFLQPTLGTAIVAGAFLLSVPFGKPLAERLAGDFCPLPDDLRANRHVRAFFRRISLLWAFTQFANASITLWLLLSQSVATFVVARAGVSALLTCAAILLSTVWFKSSMTRHGILAPRAASDPTQGIMVGAVATSGSACPATGPRQPSADGDLRQWHP